MRPARRRLAVVGMVALPALLAGCIVVTAPRPIETRLPPGFDGQNATSASPSSTAPLPAASPDQDGAGATAAPSPTAPDAIACADGGSSAISGSEQTFRLTGTCTEVTVAGTALTVDASTASIGTLSVSGDRIRVVVARVDVVTVQGNDGSVVSASGMDRLDVSGDRTSTEARAGIASVTVRGQDNVVRSGGGVGSVVVKGSGNTIR